jgi:CoA-transferase family III
MTPAVSTLDDREPIGLARWTEAGLDRLTGPESGPGLGPPNGFVDRLDGVTGRIRAASEALGKRVDVDGLRTLAVRREISGFGRRGQVSCGGSCHLVEASDGWFAVSLCRPDDWEMLPAWIGVGGVETDDEAGQWDIVHERCRRLGRDEVVERGIALGLPIGALPDRGDGRPRDDEPVTHRRSTAAGGRRPSPAAEIRVADLSSMWAGPLCGSVFAAAGAHVLKVESVSRPDGTRNGAPAMYDVLNGAKEEVLVDLSTEDGVRGLEMLLRSVDVVIESSRPRALQQLGIHAARLLDDPDGPDVWVSITGHGREGGGANRVAFGDDAAVSGGLVSRWDGEPFFCADAIADPLTGLTAAAAGLEALLGTRSTLLDVAMSRVAAHFAGRHGARVR